MTEDTSADHQRPAEREGERIVEASQEVKAIVVMPVGSMEMVDMMNMAPSGPPAPSPAAPEPSLAAPADEPPAPPSSEP
jgi:hypothetical protein